MKVLQFNKIYFAIVGIRPFERIKNPYDESVRSYIFWLIVINSGAVVAFCGTYLYKNFVDFSQLSGMIISFMLIFTTLAATGSYLSIAMNKEKSENLNDELQDIVDKIEDPTIFEAYEKTEKRCRLVTKWTPIVNAIIAIIFFLQSLIHSFVCMWCGNFETSTWFLAVRMSVPFDTSSVFGWYMLLVLQVTSSVIFGAMIESLVTYFICCCLYMVPLRDHFKLILKRIDANVCFTDTKSMKKMEEDRAYFAELISLHMKIVEIFKMIGCIGSGTFFYQLLTNVIFLALGIFSLDQGLRHFNVAATVTSLSVICVGLFWSFILCYSSSLALAVTTSISGIAYNAKWTQYPLIYRKYVLLIILRSQSHGCFKGLKLVPCNLVTFSEFMQRAWSYYVILRNLSTR